MRHNERSRVAQLRPDAAKLLNKYVFFFFFNWTPVHIHSQKAKPTGSLPRVRPWIGASCSWDRLPFYEAKCQLWKVHGAGLSSL